MSATPTYVWNPVADAEAYYLWVNDEKLDTPVVQARFQAADVCSATCEATLAAALSLGSHTWWVQARNASGDGAWSAASSFIVGSLPPAPFLISPAGTDASDEPAYTWDFQPGVTDYYLWVNGPKGMPIIQTWYSAAAACSSGDRCSVNPPVTLARGHYAWWVLGRNASGDGPWSAALSFVIGFNPGTPAPVSPTGVIPIALPTYVWTAVPETTDYNLWVNVPGAAPVVQASYVAAEACSGAICVASPTTLLADGSYQWWIQARNAVGDGPWSEPTGFTVAAQGSASP